MSCNRVSALAFVLLLSACSDPESPEVPPPLGDVVVLNGVGATGISVLAEPGGGEEKHLAFDPFDGASFSLRGDTVVSTSSKGSGDLLFVGVLGSGSVQKIQMPAASNPGGVQFAPAMPDSATKLYVALRDIGEVAEVTLPYPGRPIIRRTGAGNCPVDVIATPTKVWALDANQRCSSDYESLGPSRMLPLPGMGSVDTITFLSAVANAQRAFVVGDYAYIMSSGDYATTPGALTKVDLVSRNSVITPLDPDYYGMSFRLGANGFAYVTATPPCCTPGPFRVYAINMETMAFGGTRVSMGKHLKLTRSSGSAASCFAATADAIGNVYCVENGDLVATLVVFNPAGEQLRTSAAGSPAFDITLR
jgi:hypothetical protein